MTLCWELETKNNQHEITWVTMAGPSLPADLAWNRPCQCYSSALMIYSNLRNVPSLTHNWSTSAHGWIGQRSCDVDLVKIYHWCQSTFALEIKTDLLSPHQTYENVCDKVSISTELTWTRSPLLNWSRGPGKVPFARTPLRVLNSPSASSREQDWRRTSSQIHQHS